MTYKSIINVVGIAAVGVSVLLAGCGDKKSKGKQAAEEAAMAAMAAVEAEAASIAATDSANAEKAAERAALAAALAEAAAAHGNATFVDSRDGKTYRQVEIGSLVWMAENLNYSAEGSACYENSTGNCEKYGRMYDWATAKTACPEGWKLPDDNDWTALKNAAGGGKDAGKRLKAKISWNWNDYDKKSGDGTDAYGFSALPGGFAYGYGNPGNHAGEYGMWWSVTENNAENAWGRDMFYTKDGLHKNEYPKTYLLSVRCVQDDTNPADKEFAARPSETGVPPDSVQAINETCRIFIPLESRNFEDESSEEAEDYFTVSDDFGFYMGTTIGQFEKLKIKIVHAEKRYLSFALADGKEHIVDTKKEHSGGYLYKKGKKPVLADIEGINWKAVAKYLDMKESEVIKLTAEQ